MIRVTLIQIKIASQILLFFLVAFTLNAQPPQFKAFNYIDRYAGEAQHQMATYRIPASVILAQAIFESASGTSPLARRSNNHFGIKCKSTWYGDTITKTDDELNECFRKYNSIAESYTDHSLFLVSRPWYAPLFKLAITDYRSWCRGLKAAGYATYPTYAEELIRIIEQYHLAELDGAAVMNRQPLPARVSPEPAPARFSHQHLRLRDFAPYGLLWLDERGVLIQSLDLAIGDGDPDDELAEN